MYGYITEDGYMGNVNGKFMLFAKEMVEKVAETAGWENYEIVSVDNN